MKAPSFQRLYWLQVNGLPAPAHICTWHLPSSCQTELPRTALNIHCLSPCFGR
jgi:hypothetical protein